MPAKFDGKTCFNLCVGFLGIIFFAGLSYIIGYWLDIGHYRSMDRLKSMLKSTPMGGEVELEMWLSMKPLDLELFKEFWDDADYSLRYPLGDLPDWNLAYYEEWQDEKGIYFGMRRFDNGKKHGIVREILNNGTIIEGSWKLNSS